MRSKLVMKKKHASSRVAINLSIDECRMYMEEHQSSSRANSVAGAIWRTFDKHLAKWETLGHRYDKKEPIF